MKKALYISAFVLFSYIPFIEKKDYEMEGEVLEVQIKQNFVTYLLKRNDGAEVFESKSLYLNPEFYYLRKGMMLKETKTSQQSLFGKGLELIIGTTTEIFNKPQKTKYEFRTKTFNDYNQKTKKT